MSAGDPARFRKLFEKAERGEEIVLGVIGGSISTGSLASKPGERGYFALVCDWWQKQFPQARIKRVNAAVAGTGSLFGVLRVEQDLLAQKPDAVIVEFAVNDAWTDQDPFESLVRRLLAASPDLAVMLLFMSYDNGHNEQTWQQAVGKHYGLPMVSFRDAIWPEVSRGLIKPSDVLVDIVHPNDQGHQITADLVTASLEALRHAPAGAAQVGGQPAPLAPTHFEKARWIDAQALQPTARKGWELVKNNNLNPILLGHMAWRAAQPDASALTLDWEGTGLVAMMMLANDDPAEVSLVIDERPKVSVTLRTQPRRNIVSAGLELPRGRHRFSLSRANNAPGTPAFGLFGIGVLP
ncbi:SGNH/GDSL hydrolase family protein [Xaviernesmea oryzae]|uniref:SGNH/GDSL hydrolase family protein n=1 Tax=Xaviernesmea oryzae TaxID=464029 RepID=UPI00147E02F4|nr:SGNH/GDSL hydrolase family protein [Xaviernesmea oryzae]